jgi:hypothetical protein
LLWYYGDQAAKSGLSLPVRQSTSPEFSGDFRKNNWFCSNLLESALVEQFHASACEVFKFVHRKPTNSTAATLTAQCETIKKGGEFVFAEICGCLALIRVLLCCNAKRTDKQKNRTVFG